MRNLLFCLALCCLALLIPGEGNAFFGNSGNSEGYSSLSELADNMAKEMKSSHAGKKLYIDKEDIKSDQNDAVLPFAALLARELERSLNGVGFQFAGNDATQADILISISYHLTSDSLQLYVKLKDHKNDSYQNLSKKYEITINKLPDGCLVETLDARIARLASKISRSWQRPSKLKLFVTPMFEAGIKIPNPFTEYATRKLRSTLSSMNNLLLMDDKPEVMQKLAKTRSIQKEDVTVDTGAAAIIGADAVLEGSYVRGAGAISVTVMLKDIKGTIIYSADDTIPLSQITYSLNNASVETQAKIADTEHEKSDGMVKIGTTKGPGNQIYFNGEEVKFTIIVGKPLYLYVYGINSKKEVELLFPKIGESESPRLPGILHTLPSESDSWVIRVEPPYGTDAVKVFASEKQLPVPTISDKTPTRSFSGNTRTLKRQEVQTQLAAQTTINAQDLVDYYKGVAEKVNANLYESSVFVVTKSR